MFNNVMNISEQIAILGLIAAGATILIIPGSSDVSVGAVTGLSSCLMAMMMNAGIPIPAATAVGILTAIFYMFFDRIFAALLKVPSFIISLATTSAYTGVTLYLTRRVTQTVYGKFDATSRLHPFRAVLLVFIISPMGCVVVSIILRYIQIGRRTFAVGSNEKAVFLSGIKVTRSKLILFIMNSFFVGLAAILLPSRVGLALPSTGAGYEFQAMNAVVIGGAPINDGKGNVVGTFFGVLPMGLISNMPDMLGVDSYLQETVSDALIIISLRISAVRVHMSTKNQGDSR